jgi:PAS domain-containing protein
MAAMRDGDDKGDFDALALDGLALGVFVVDADWTIRSFNAEAERITGYRRDEVLGRKCHEVFYFPGLRRGLPSTPGHGLRRPVRSGRLDILDKSAGGGSWRSRPRP